VIVTARKLANASPGKPRQADLRRAISTAYYALFHAMAKDVADMFVGVGTDRPDKAWSQTFRSLQHSDARIACDAIKKLNFAATIEVCAEAFVNLQKQRHDADYDPDVRYNRVDALYAIHVADDAIRNLMSSSKKDRRAFAVLLLLKKRR
jgi:uncharacterized protein (UPF0332 family)